MPVDNPDTLESTQRLKNFFFCSGRRLNHIFYKAFNRHNTIYNKVSRLREYSGALRQEINCEAMLATRGYRIHMSI
ncbi:hypothetical protein AYI69_g9866 [Smittium culicis]|uniref:Uncharacterized protein n=1 Tax=Smittium culicis TaxID=133412 RepID=A0A1R1X9S7_9FUNG|nr:hypothetical protein AYI69_g9866 [Smittium culicis]